MTSSPVTMRTRMCAACASATAAFDSSRGGSIIATRLVISTSWTYASKSPFASKLATSMSRNAAAITRRPSSPIRVMFCSARCFRSSSHGMLVPLESAVDARSITDCAMPLT